MEYLVTQVSKEAEDHQDWTAVTGPEGILGHLATGQEDVDYLDLQGRLDQRVRKESLVMSQVAKSRVFQVYQDPPVLLES